MDKETFIEAAWPVIGRRVNKAALLAGIVEDQRMTLQTYEVLRRVQKAKPMLTLFSHDPANTRKLEAWCAQREHVPVRAD